jgi:hypothetical protein
MQTSQACLYYDALFKQQLEAKVLAQRQETVKAFRAFESECNIQTAEALDIERKKLHVITKNLNLYRGFT